MQMVLPRIKPGEIEIAGIADALDKQTAGRGIVEIADDRADIADLAGNHKAEDQQLQERRHEEDHQHAAVAAHLNELFFNDVKYLPQRLSPPD